ncbi:hypothetical protein Moror_8681 [Moniliophthora roreri MCA 2997]|uniref:Uncharacterized protein n=2 Tax=Moniliophthora roreri TaxID=221103 RepID=V2XAX2_MONRO|nr:hypothetical protein Moror_8681 [Moniliophthora roreri MCA 2997]KAI3611299.1 hypothetical protein WG66_002232 [Moniliophthora roreri]
MAMEHKASRQLRISSTRKSFPRHRHHPYPRPVYLGCSEEDTACAPRLDGDSLLVMIRDAERGKQGPVPLVQAPAIGANNAKEENNAEEDIEEGHNRLVLGGVLLLDFLVALFFFMRQILLAGFLIRDGRVDDGE